MKPQYSTKGIPKNKQNYDQRHQSHHAPQALTAPTASRKQMPKQLITQVQRQILPKLQQSNLPNENLSSCTENIQKDNNNISTRDQIYPNHHSKSELAEVRNHFDQFNNNRQPNTDMNRRNHEGVSKDVLEQNFYNQYFLVRPICHKNILKNAKLRNGQMMEGQSSSDETEDDNMFFRFEAVIKDIDDLGIVQSILQKSQSQSEKNGSEFSYEAEEKSWLSCENPHEHDLQAEQLKNTRKFKQLIADSTSIKIPKCLVDKELKRLKPLLLGQRTSPLQQIAAQRGIFTANLSKEVQKIFDAPQETEPLTSSNEEDTSKLTPKVIPKPMLKNLSNLQTLQPQRLVPSSDSEEQENGLIGTASDMTNILANQAGVDSKAKPYPLLDQEIQKFAQQVDQKFLTLREYNETAIENQALRQHITEKEIQLDNCRQLIASLQQELYSMKFSTSVDLSGHMAPRNQLQHLYQHHSPSRTASGYRLALMQAEQHHRGDQLALDCEYPNGYCEKMNGNFSKDEQQRIQESLRQKQHPEIYVENCEEQVQKYANRSRNSEKYARDSEVDNHHYNMNQNIQNKQEDQKSEESSSCSLKAADENLIQIQNCEDDCDDQIYSHLVTQNQENASNREIGENSSDNLIKLKDDKLLAMSPDSAESPGQEESKNVHQLALSKADIDFLKETILKLSKDAGKLHPQNKDSSYKKLFAVKHTKKRKHSPKAADQSGHKIEKEYKVKKWSLHEMGRLVFCLWQVHQKKNEMQSSSSVGKHIDMEKIEEASIASPRSSPSKSRSRSPYNRSNYLACLPFYKSLQDLFNSFDLTESQKSSKAKALENQSGLSDKRTKDIIYSKLQKQRTSLLKFEEIVNLMQKSETKKKFKTSDFKKIESVVKIYEGIKEFCKLQEQLGAQSVVFKLLAPGERNGDGLKRMLTEFKNVCIPQFLQKGGVYEKMFHDSLTATRLSQIFDTFDNLKQIHQTFSTVRCISASNRPDSEEKQQNIFRVQQFQDPKSKNSSHQENKRLKKVTEKLSKEGKYHGKTLKISSDIKLEEYQMLKLMPEIKETESKNENQHGLMLSLKNDEVEERMPTVKEEIEHGKERLKRNFAHRQFGMLGAGGTSLNCLPSYLNRNAPNLQFMPTAPAANGSFYQSTTMASSSIPSFYKRQKFDQQVPESLQMSTEKTQMRHGSLMEKLNGLSKPKPPSAPELFDQIDQSYLKLNDSYCSKLSQTPLRHQNHQSSFYRGRVSEFLHSNYMNLPEEAFQGQSAAYRRLKREEESSKVQKSMLSAKGRSQIGEGSSNLPKQGSYFAQNPSAALEHMGPMGGVVKHFSKEQKIADLGRFTKADLLEQKHLATNLSISKHLKQIYPQQSVTISEHTDHYGHPGVNGQNHSSSAAYLGHPGHYAKITQADQGEQNQQHAPNSSLMSPNKFLSRFSMCRGQNHSALPKPESIIDMQEMQKVMQKQRAHQQPRPSVVIKSPKPQKAGQQ